jgi:hypothetical protein
MRQAVAALLILSAVASACSGNKTAAPTIPPATTPDTVTTAAETSITSAPPSTEPTTTVAPSTTIDEAAILAEAEAAYLEAFKIGKEALRNPLNPANEERIKERFTDANLALVLENLRLTIDGNYISRENETNPSFAVIVKPAEFIDPADPTLAIVEVCEFNSDKLYEVGAAPDGSDALVRDDPVSIILAVRLQLVDGAWKSKSGGVGQELKGEAEQCSSAV